MTEFKLVRRVHIFEEVIIDAESKEQALAMYQGKVPPYEDECIGGWDEDDVSGSESFLWAIEERDTKGEFSIVHRVDEKEEKFV